MSVLSKLLRHDAQPADVEVACPHKALTARWDRNEDIGKEARATGFRCEACGATFSGDDGRRLLHQARSDARP